MTDSIEPGQSPQPVVMAARARSSLVALARNPLAAISAALAIFFCVTSLIGGYLNYSPVPYWDMWDGYLVFFTQVSHGVTSAWWNQHAEHRLVVGNALFWLDIACFHGTAVFLITMSYLMVALIAGLFVTIIRMVFHPMSTSPSTTAILVFSVIAVTASWIQKENMTHPFQASFFPSLLFPMAALYGLHLALAGSSRRLLVLAIFLGVLSCVTMANGLAVLPLMAVMVFVYGGSRKLGALLLALAAFCILAYFHAWKPPEINGSIVDSVVNHKIDMIQYVLVYLGAPFGYASKSDRTTIALVAGGISILFLLAALARTFLREDRCLPDYLLVFIIAFIGLSATAAAGGRVKFGLDQATSGRYMTYALAYWSSLSILLCSAFRDFPVHGRLARFLPLILPVALVPYQATSLDSADAVNFDKMLAALALEMGVRDSQQIGNVFPWLDVAFILAEKPREMNISIFGNPLIRDVREMIDAPYVGHGAKNCSGSIDSVQAIADTPQYVKVAGWLMDASTGRSPRAVALVGDHGQMVGYGLNPSDTSTGSAPDTDPNAFRFIAYLKANAVSQPLKLYGRDPDCVVGVEPSPARTFNLSAIRLP